MKITTLALILVVLTSAKVYACGDGSCEPPPPPPPVVEQPKDDKDEEHQAYNRIYYSVCTCDKMRVAWGFESLEFRINKARSQCEIRRTERLKCLTKWK